jgi:hypothetical protein
VRPAVLARTFVARIMWRRLEHVRA